MKSASSSRTPLLSHLRILTAGALISAAAAMALVAASSPTATSTALPSDNGVYIVQMSPAPAVAYTGDIAGYKATAPKPGQKIDPTAPDTINYVNYLKGKHDEALKKVGGGP